MVPAARHPNASSLRSCALVGGARRNFYALSALKVRHHAQDARRRRPLRPLLRARELPTRACLRARVALAMRGILHTVERDAASARRPPLRVARRRVRRGRAARLPGDGADAPADLVLRRAGGLRAAVQPAARVPELPGGVRQVRGDARGGDARRAAGGRVAAAPRGDRPLAQRRHGLHAFARRQPAALRDELEPPRLFRELRAVRLDALLHRVRRPRRAVDGGEAAAVGRALRPPRRLGARDRCVA